jgi:acetyl esterase/lipase
MSPVLADDDLLRKLPKTYLVVLEWDVLRDEELAYSYRLKKNDVDIELDFHEDAFHGIYAFAYQGIEFKKSIKILENLKDYLKRNL